MNENVEHLRRGRSTRYSRQEWDTLHPNGPDSDVDDLHVYALGYNKGMKAICISTRTCTMVLSVLGFVNQSNNVAITPGSSYLKNSNGHKRAVFTMGGGIDGGEQLQRLLGTEGQNIDALAGRLNVVRCKKLGIFETDERERVNVAGNKLLNRIGNKHFGSANPQGKDPNKGSQKKY